MQNVRSHWAGPLVGLLPERGRLTWRVDLASLCSTCTSCQYSYCWLQSPIFGGTWINMDEAYQEPGHIQHKERIADRYWQVLPLSLRSLQIWGEEKSLFYASFWRTGASFWRPARRFDARRVVLTLASFWRAILTHASFWRVILTHQKGEYIGIPKGDSLIIWFNSNPNCVNLTIPQRSSNIFLLKNN